MRRLKVRLGNRKDETWYNWHLTFEWYCIDIQLFFKNVSVYIRASYPNGLILWYCFAIQEREGNGRKDVIIWEPYPNTSNRSWDYNFVRSLKIVQGRADINCRNNTRATPLHLACNEGNNNTIELLVNSKADVNAQDEDGDTPLHTMLMKQSVRDIVGSTPMGQVVFEKRPFMHKFK